MDADGGNPANLTHSLMSSILQATGFRIDEIRISTLEDQVFFAALRLRSGERVVEVDARPSDALALAARTDTPIVAAEELLQKAALALPADLSSGASKGGMESILDNHELLPTGTVRGLSEIEPALPELLAFVFGKAT